MRADQRINSHKILSDAKRRVHFDEADSVAKEWWESLETLNKDQPVLVYKLAKELEKRGISINDFFDVWLHCQLEDLEAILKLLDKLLQDSPNLKNPAKPHGIERKQAVASPQKQTVSEKNLPTSQLLQNGKLIFRPQTKIVH